MPYWQTMQCIYSTAQLRRLPIGGISWSVSSAQVSSRQSLVLRQETAQQSQGTLYLVGKGRLSVMGGQGRMPRDWLPCEPRCQRAPTLLSLPLHWEAHCRASAAAGPYCRLQVASRTARITEEGRMRYLK